MKKAVILAAVVVSGAASFAGVPTANPPFIWEFTITPPYAVAGGSIEISWIVIAADSVTIDPGVGDVGLAGTVSLPLTEPGTTTITLTARNAGGVTVVQQSVETLVFENTYGAKYDDEGFSVCLAPDGGYVFTGFLSSKSWEGEDICLFKTDSLGRTVWQKTFGGAARDEGYAVAPTMDGGFILTGLTQSPHGYNEIILIKTDSAGNKAWEKILDMGDGQAVLQTSDGGYAVLAGSILIKTDALGNVQWKKGTAAGSGYACQQTSDGGFIVTGRIWFTSTLDYDLFLVKLDASGNREWYKTFGSSDWDSGNAVRQTPDGGYVVAGYRGYPGSCWVLKTNSLGTLLWDNLYSGEAGNAVVVTADGGSIVAGEYSNAAGGTRDDVYLLRLDASGNILWEKSIGDHNDELARYLQQTPDGGLIVVGFRHYLSYDAGTPTHNDILLLKVK